MSMETLENREKTAEKLRVYTYKITNISDPSCPRVANVVPY